MKAFKDISIFQNIVQFSDGEKMIRAIRRDSNIYDIYLYHNNDYIHNATITTQRKSPRGIYSAYLNA